MGLLDAMSEPRVMTRESVAATVAIRHTWIARWKGRVAKLAAITHSAQVSQQLMRMLCGGRSPALRCSQTNI
jgi:hypothetical protein